MQFCEATEKRKEMQAERNSVVFQKEHHHAVSVLKLSRERVRDSMPTVL